MKQEFEAVLPLKFMDGYTTHKKNKTEKKKIDKRWLTILLSLLQELHNSDLLFYFSTNFFVIHFQCVKIPHPRSHNKFQLKRLQDLGRSKESPLCVKVCKELCTYIQINVRKCNAKRIFWNEWMNKWFIRLRNYQINQLNIKKSKRYVKKIIIIRSVEVRRIKLNLNYLS